MIPNEKKKKIMIDLRPIYTSTSASLLLIVGIVLLAAGIILITIITCVIIIDINPKKKHAIWLQHIGQWAMDTWIDNIIGLILTAWLIVLCIIMGALCVISISPLRQAAAEPKPPSTHAIVSYVESKTDVTHLSCDDDADTNNIIPCTFVLDNTPRDGKLVIDNDHATLFYNDNATFVPVTDKTTN